VCLPIPPSSLALVHSALHSSSSPPSKVVSQIGSDPITLANLRTLLPGSWLSDEVIHFWYALLLRRDADLCDAHPGRRRSHFFKSFFFTKLFESGEYKYAGVKRWSKNVAGKDVFALDKIFVPCNCNNVHWTCLCVHVRERRIVYYDSMGGGGGNFWTACCGT